MGYMVGKSSQALHEHVDSSVFESYSQECGSTHLGNILYQHATLNIANGMI